MALSLNLTKAEKSLKLCLQKSGLLDFPQVDLAFVLDVSGSFDDEHRAGITDALLTRLVPWGMTFDPDRKLDVFTFSGGKSSAHRVGTVTPGNCESYVQREIIGKVPGYGTGTDYSPVMERVLQEFGWLAESAGLLQRLFGSHVGSTQPRMRRPSLIIFVTDGENSDQSRTIDTLTQSQQRGDKVYFMFVGVSNQGGKFPFLNQIATRFSNTGLTVIHNLRSFTAQDDDQLNTRLLQPELLAWLAKHPAPA
jgi:hypothetical protein